MQNGKKVKHKQRDHREGEKHRLNEKKKRESVCVHERDSGREMSVNVGMMSGRGLPRHGAMHDGNTSHTRGACL